MVTARRRVLTDLDQALDLASTGYADAPEMLVDLLDVVRHRIHVAADGIDVAARVSDLAAREALMRARREASASRCLPLAVLRSCFALGDDEERLLWVLIAHELCPESRRALRDLNTEQVSDVTTDTLRRVVYGNAAASRRPWQDLAESGPLRRFHLIERTDGVGAVPLHRQTWKVADRVLALAHGERCLDPSLSDLASVGDGRRSLCELVLAPGVAHQLFAACRGNAIVVATGCSASGRRSTLDAILAEHGRRALVIDARRVSKDRDRADRELRLLSRECVLLGLVPLIRDADALCAVGDTPDRFELVETHFEGLVCAISSRPIARHWRRPVHHVELAPITCEQRRELWTRALVTASTEQADALANLYPLTPGLIDAMGRAIRGSMGDGPLTRDHVTAGLRAVLDDRMAGLATRLATTQSWSDLVLPADQAEAVIELMSRIRDRSTVYEEWGFAAKVGKGLGVTALFSGPPGTGKSMTAALIAREIELEVYQVDLSKVVSKWIGETEKNLSALFDAAEAGHAILLFDEADALFGKRTNVTSSNDRFANQEVNYLLQRLESFRGVAILTTNHPQALDDAFRRRLSIHVQFPMPEVAERLMLWRAMLPQRAPVEGDLELEKLAARFEMSGGYIRNAVLRSAFLAVGERAPIRAAHLARAAQLEYEAMGKFVL